MFGCCSVVGRKKKKRARAVPWDPAPTFAETHSLSPYANDDDRIRAATLTLRPWNPKPTSARGYDYSEDDDDDNASLRYAFARSALAALRRAPRDAAASHLQRVLRGRLARRRVLVLERARASRGHRETARAFRTWTEVARALGVAAFSLQSTIAKLVRGQLAKAWRTWCRALLELARREALELKVLGRLVHGRWVAAAWLSWTKIFVWARRLEALVAAAARVWVRAVSSIAWRSWLGFVEAVNAARRELLVRRVLAHLGNSGLALCATAFLEWKRVVLRVARLTKIGARALERWCQKAVARAYGKWRLCSRRRRPRVLRSGPRLRLLGAGQACPTPPDPRVACVEHRLRSLERLAKQLQLYRLEEQLSNARTSARIDPKNVLLQNPPPSTAHPLEAAATAATRRSDGRGRGRKKKKATDPLAARAQHERCSR